MNNTKLLIQDKLLEFMKTQDIHTIKVKHLADSLGISRSTFYLYYDSVFSVLQDLEDDFFEQLQNIAALFWHYPLDKRYLNEPHPINLKVFNLLKKHQERFTILFGPHGDPVFQTRVNSMIQHHLCPMRIMKTLYPNHTELIVSYKIGGHLRQINCWLKNPHLATEKEMAIITYRDMFGDAFN